MHSYLIPAHGLHFNFTRLHHCNHVTYGLRFAGYNMTAQGVAFRQRQGHGLPPELRVISTVPLPERLPRKRQKTGAATATAAEKREPVGNRKGREEVRQLVSPMLYEHHHVDIQSETHKRTIQHVPFTRRMSLRCC